MTDLLRNLEGIQPVAARGFEAWFRLNRDVKGATGPRLIQLASRIFYPSRAKAGTMGAALEAWEADIREFEQSGQRLGPILKNFGLTRLVPKEDESDLMKLQHQFKDYAGSRTWILKQEALRGGTGKSHRSDAHGVWTEESPDECLPCHGAGGEEPTEEEIMALG